MPAPQFFAVLRAAKKREIEKWGYIFHEATFVALCGHPRMETRAVEEIRQTFHNRYAPPETRKIMDNEKAGAVLGSILGSD